MCGVMRACGACSALPHSTRAPATAAAGGSTRKTHAPHPRPHPHPRPRPRPRPRQRPALLSMLQRRAPHTHRCCPRTRVCGSRDVWVMIGGCGITVAWIGRLVAHGWCGVWVCVCVRNRGHGHGSVPLCCRAGFAAAVTDWRAAPLRRRAPLLWWDHAQVTWVLVELVQRRRGTHHHPVAPTHRTCASRRASGRSPAPCFRGNARLRHPATCRRVGRGAVGVQRDIAVHHTCHPRPSHQHQSQHHHWQCTRWAAS